MQKNNKVKLYAKALADIASPKPKGEGGSDLDDEQIVKRFLKLLEKDGLQKKAKQILDLAEDLLLRKQGKNKITFEIARRLTTENRALLKQFVREGDVVKEKINHELIAGVKITINGEKQFDNSMLSKLNNIL